MSLRELASAEWALVRLFDPFFHATPVENVSAWKFFDDFIFFETINTDGAGSGAFFHNHCLNVISFRLSGIYFLNELFSKGNDFCGHGVKLK
jgi:hypothetical protein